SRRLRSFHPHPWDGRKNHDDERSQCAAAATHQRIHSAKDHRNCARECLVSAEVKAVRRLREVLGEAWYFLRDSTPSRRRQRYGDIQFDFDHNVNTTAAALAWRTRLRGLLGGSLYQPTEESLFREMMAALPI